MGKVINGYISKQLRINLTKKEIKVESLDSNVLRKHISNTERGIACLLGTVFDGEVVTINEIATYANMDYRIVKKAVEGLQEGGFKVNLKN